MLKQAVLFVGLAILLMGVVIRFGVPLLIKLAVFLGDIRGGKSGTTEIEDVMAPAKPTLVTLPEATPSGTLTVSGFAQAGMMVNIFLNGNPGEDISVDDNGEFSDEISLRAGDNRIWAIARDPAGKKESPRSEEMTVVMDDDPPQVTLDAPEDGSVATSAEITVEGLTDEDATVTVSGRWVTVKNDLSFMTTLSLNEGENVITVTARDRAGNETTKTVKVNYSR